MGVYIIAEAGVNHNGDINVAKKLVEMAASCGADAIKFQAFKANECTGEYAKLCEYQKRNTDYASQKEMVQNLELPFSDFSLLKKYAQQLGIDFIATPDGLDSLKCLLDLEIPMLKISSTDVTNLPFLKEVALSGKKLILSTGMSTLGEVENAVNVIKSNGNEKIILMHCTTSYPTEIEDVNIRAMKTMKEAFGLPVGYSDHTLTNEAAISAVTLGAVCIEKHITLDQNMQGPDHQASMEPKSFRQYVKSIRNTEKLLGDGIKKPTRKELEIMKDVRRSVLASREIKAGTVLEADMLCIKRPGDGISPLDLDKIVGMKVNRNINKEEKICWSDLK